ncbi:MAG: glycoside hydrolase family 71/99-like protein, partial [Verrucomicrobiota bacterium]
EFDADEKFATPFVHADGATAHVFSSLNPKTVNRHFQWMADYQIDGAFIQRFGVLAARSTNNFRKAKADNQKLMLCRDAANKAQRNYALMYDLSGLHTEDFPRLIEDWKQLRRKMQLGTDPNDSSYLKVNGKPLVSIWGVGFSDDRKYGLQETEKFIRLLKHNPEWGGFSIMLGVPYNWRSLKGDAVDDEHLHKILALADVISPWAVGRYRSPEDVRRRVTQQLIDDRVWCQKKNIDYFPVVFPGFSWGNLYGEEESGIPRLGGRFFHEQFLAVRAAGIDTAYVAMFDEIDEATAVFKCTNDPPVGESKFGTYEGLPSDHYLWLCQEGRRVLRGELPAR